MTNLVPKVLSLKFAMLLVLAATNKGPQIKSLEYQILSKIRKQGCFFYETIQANIYLFGKGLLVQKNGNINLCVKYEKYA